MAKRSTKRVSRSAISGRFTTKANVRRRPKTTVTETVRRGRRR